MRRRAKAAGKAVKTQRRKTLRRRNAPKAARPHKSPAAAEETEVARLRRELNEALEQQTATSEVLKVISSSPGDLNLVFEAILENATRICMAEFGILVLYQNGGFRYVASHGAPPAYIELRQREPFFRPGPEHPLSRTAATKQVVHILDTTTLPEQARGGLVAFAGAKTLVSAFQWNKRWPVDRGDSASTDVSELVDRQADRAGPASPPGRHRD